MQQLTFKVGLGSDMVKIDNRVIGNRVKEARQAAGFTQAALADRLGLSQPAINLIERGDNSLTLENLYKLSEVLNRPVSYFLGVGVGELDREETEWLQFYKDVPPEDRPTIVELLRGYIERLRRK